MAALSRPSLRSSSRQNTAVDDLAVSDLQHNPNPPTVRPAKRVRDASSVENDLKSLKKHKANASAPTSPNPIVLPCKEESSAGPSLQGGNGPLAHHDPVANSNHAQPSSEDSISTSARGQSFRKRHNHVVDGAEATITVDKRSLRSHDGGARLKSELSLYFANYDELLSTEAKQHDFPTAETLIQFTDDPCEPDPSCLPSPTHRKPAHHKAPPLAILQPLMVNGSSQTLQRSENSVQEFNDAQRIDFSSIDRHTGHNAVDLLTDAVYFKAHRRAERQEKQLRNIEKERAQHEKVQLERLLERLKGHDWLRVMGINGITDSEKKVFEPKRDYFIQEVTVLIEKFRMWKEEEKRRKAAKEQNLLDEESRCDAASTSNGDTSTPSEVDASAARQLHKEVNSAIGPRSGRRKKPPALAPAPTLAESLSPEKRFTSFFPKPYLRDAAIGKHRRGRTKIAFGHPIPDFLEKDFSLPADMLSQEAIAASARSRRRARRESKDV